MKKSIFVIISLILISSPVAVHAEWNADSETIEDECANIANLEAACLQRYQTCGRYPHTGNYAEKSFSIICWIEYEDCLENLEDLCDEKERFIIKKFELESKGEDQEGVTLNGSVSATITVEKTADTRIPPPESITDTGALVCASQHAEEGSCHFNRCICKSEAQGDPEAIERCDEIFYHCISLGNFRF